jgi:hypothetical protein
MCCARVIGLFISLLQTIKGRVLLWGKSEILILTGFSPVEVGDLTINTLMENSVLILDFQCLAVTVQTLKDVTPRSVNNMVYDIDLSLSSLFSL